MFHQNRYTKIYLSIIDRARSEPRTKRGSVYYESHHVIPKSLGGSDNPENLVLLTAREHILCHRLLTRMTSGKDLIRMKHAFFFIVFATRTSKRKAPPSRQVALAREFLQQQRDPAWRENISRARIGQKPTKEAIEAMATKLRGRKLSEEHKANISRNNARTAAKTFEVIDPLGNRSTIHNLRLWCQERNFKYQNAYLSAKLGRVCRNKGPMQGYQFIRS